MPFKAAGLHRSCNGLFKSLWYYRMILKLSNLTQCV